MDAINTHEAVRDYYGKILSSNKDLKTSACCAATAPPLHIQETLNLIDDEILDRFYGCGAPIPPALDGQTVLDLGSGTGRDVYICSKLVGENGTVIGIDMTDEQLEVARRHEQAQADRFHYGKPNTRFIKGYMEELDGAGIEDNSVDVVISNCVINLSPDKGRVFSEILRVLKPGGELYFSDVFADRRLSTAVRQDPVIVGECLGGALYIEDFRRMLNENGIMDYRIVKSNEIEVHDQLIREKLGNAKFYSLTIRAMKLDLEDRCEDYGQVAVYKGTIPYEPNRFALDDHHVFEAGKPLLVCGNTASMLQDTRFAKHFQVIGDRSVHHGAFPCGEKERTENVSPSCC